MKKAKYIRNPFGYIIPILIPFVLMGLIFIIGKEYLVGILAFGGGLLLISPYIFMRKFTFAKMIIDDEGIKVYYRGKVTKQIKWEDIKDAQATSSTKSRNIIFSNKPLYTGKESWKNIYEINVYLSDYFISELSKYKNKIPVPIRDLDKLHKSIQKELQK